jgi:hypothetical protein
MQKLIPALLAILVSLSHVQAQTADEKKATIAYLRELQMKSGGFRDGQANPFDREQPSLRATSAALRALKYFGGEVPDKPAAAKFVASCFSKAKGGFVNNPAGREPDVIVTAVGLMAVVELKMPRDPYVPAGIKYLEAKAKSFEQIRMVAAALEMVQEGSAKAADWMKEATKNRKRDGTYGEGAGAARDTASVVVTVLRLGGKVAPAEPVLKTLKGGQRKDGGFGKADAAGSDLETCYRVMRAFHMLKEKPADVAALRKFVAQCRNADGGYGIAPGRASSAASTYFASIVLYWLNEK